MDIGASANLEVVDKFCYLDDMLSVDGDADACSCGGQSPNWMEKKSGSWYCCLPIGYIID